jgi:hypothetical protein
MAQNLMSRVKALEWAHSQKIGFLRQGNNQVIALYFGDIPHMGFIHFKHKANNIFDHKV